MKRGVILMVVAILFLGNGWRTANAEEIKGDKPAEINEEHYAVNLTKAMFLEKIWDFENSPQEWKFKGDKPVLIDFYADWCGPCRTAAPILEEIAKEYKGKIDVYKINTQRERELASVFQVRGIPAFLYIPVEGKPSMTSGIGRSKVETKKMFVDQINKLLLSKK